jgi:hypothetical protein
MVDSTVRLCQLAQAFVRDLVDYDREAKISPSAALRAPQLTEPTLPGGALDRGRGDVDPERTACLGRACGLSGCLPSSTADVEGVVVRLDASGPPQYLVAPP